ncbi:sterol O-acyltransferase 1 isoform X2 [Tiliqua scincoides]
MVGEDNISLRTRRSAYGTLEEKGDSSRGFEEEWSFSKSSNGEIDVDHLTRRKMQLLAKAEHLKPAFMEGVDSHFTEFVNGLVAKSALLESSPSVFPTKSEKDGYKTKESRAASEHGKVFVARKSLLDELFEVDHIQTIYHMFIALLILFILSTLVVDFIDEGRLVLEFDLLVYSFGKLSVAASVWPYMFLSTLLVPYGLFLQWAQSYHGSSHKTICSLFFGGLLMIFQTIGLGLVPTYIVLSYDLPPASRAIVITEQVRLVMKAHSFIRENVPRVISSSPQKSNSVQVPQLSQYLYFLFAPTLIYRDHYPRTPTTRWSYVATKFAQVLGSLFYAYYIFVRLCIPIYRNYSREPFSLRGQVLCIFNSILPGVLMILLMFFAVLHCWLNAFAEMLRFADRTFYKDWWNSRSFSNYYRTWNVVVHDWLYCYVYRDFFWLFGKRFRAAAMLSVFSISAVVHEYILAVCFGYFYPVLFCLFFCFGMVFNFILHDHRKGPIWNVIMWTSLFLGTGIILCLYSQEWYARQNCPLKNPTFLDYVKPRSWTCHVKI